MLKVILLLLISFSPIYADGLQFFREDITFEIKDNFFIVDGYYYFKNNSNNIIKERLFYPFPQKEIYGEVDLVFASDYKHDLRNTKLHIRGNGASFMVEVQPDSVSIMHVGYRQKIISNQAEYILETTQNWKQSFQQVNYSLIFPKSYALDSLSYTPDSLQTQKKKYIFYWHKQDFMPHRNFIVKFGKE